MSLDPYASGVLVPEHHDRLVADLDNFALDAGIQKHWIWKPLAESCNAAEIAYVKQFARHKASGEIAGICYTGSEPTLDVESHMFALAGCLVRNFVRAKVTTLNVLLDTLAEGVRPDCSCLLVPNFFIPKAEGGEVASWKVTPLLDLLMHRQTSGLQTVIYAESLNLLGKEYGTAFKRFVQNHYQTISI